MDITILDETGTLTKEQLTEMEKLINFSASHETLKLPEDTEMSLTFLDDQAIWEINKEHRNKDQATDVISFAMEEDSTDGFVFDFEEFDMPRNIGDIFVSVEHAKKQALEYNHSFDRELGFLVVHGFLHLNGYDHMTEEDEKEMFDLQRGILNEYGLKR